MGTLIYFHGVKKKVLNKKKGVKLSRWTWKREGECRGGGRGGRRIWGGSC